MKDSIYSLRPEDSIIPDCSDNPELQDKWNKLGELISAYSLYKALAIKAGREFGPGPVINLVSQICQENIERKKNRKGQIKVSATFRQRIRQWKTTKTDEAHEAITQEHIAEVEESFRKGVRPMRSTLWNMVAAEKNVDADILRQTLQFLSTLPPIGGEEVGSFDAIIEENEALLSMPVL